MIGYGYIKDLQKELKKQGIKRDIKDLLVEVDANDPFYAGLPCHRAQAEWFVNLWKKFGSEIGIHLRGIHYRLVSQKNPKRFNSKLYRNIRRHYNELCNASKYARYLGLIPLDAVVDKRNPEPRTYPFNNSRDRLGWYSDIEQINWILPSIDFDLTRYYLFNWELPDLYTEGYSYDSSLQPYHLEIWVEKSTMDDLLIPLCDQYKVNLQTGLGFMSIPSVTKLLERIVRLNKPTRILYISDFDPAGKGMPIGVARQIEYWLANPELWLKEDREFDIKLEPIILTDNQRKYYQLPRTPIKKTDRRRTHWEEVFGKGAVELDALRALHPGEFEKIVEQHILEFRDMDLEDRVEEAESNLQEKLSEEREEIIEPYEKDLEKIKDEAKEILGSYEGELEKLSTRLDGELEPLSEDLKKAYQAIQEKIEAINVEIPPLPKPEIEEKNRAWLFDSGRNYLEQLKAFKEAQGKQL